MWKNHGRARCAMLALMFAVSTLLSACDGGGGGGNDDDTMNPPDALQTAQGVFVDSPVEGLDYLSGSLAGTTDSDGTFEYEVEQSVTFAIGGIVLGSAVGAAIITPLELVPEAVDETDAHVVNIVRLLLTLDDDADPTNGIQITVTMRESAAEATIDFDQSVTDFENDGNVQAVVDELTTASTASTRPLIRAADALAHFRETLTTLNDSSGGGGTEITEELFIQSLLRTSVLRVESRAEFVQVQDIGDVTVTTDADVTAYQAVSLLVNSATDILTDSCTLRGPEQSAEDEIFEGNVVGDGNDDSCMSKYFKINDTTYRLEQMCDGVQVGTATFVIISHSSDFDLGALTINSTQFPDANADSGVCGQLVVNNSEITVTPQPNELEVLDSAIRNTTMQIVAPYTSDNRVSMELTFQTNNATPGTYSVTEDVTAAGNLVRVRVRSAEFGGTAEDPESMDGVSGTVTIDTISLPFASGSFDFVTDTGDTLTGDFVLDLR